MEFNILLALLAGLTLTVSSVGGIKQTVKLQADQLEKIVIKRPMSLDEDTGGTIMKELPQDGDEMIDVETELMPNGDINLNFSSHGRKHSLELTDSGIKLADIAVKLVGSSEEYTQQVLEEVKNIRMMRDVKRGATVAFKIQDGEVKPLIQRGLFKLGRHQFDMTHDTLSNRTKVTRKPANDKFDSSNLKAIIPKDERRQKREIPVYVTPVNAKVEIVMVVDYSMWRERTSGAVVAESQTSHTIDVILYFAHMADIMNGYFSMMKNADIGITVDLAGVVIITSPDELTELVEDYDHSGLLDGSLALTRFYAWLQTDEADDTLPPYDHVMLFTGYDLYSVEDDTISYTLTATYYTGHICSTTGAASSLIESNGLLTSDARLAAYALGANLGAHHDGTEGSSGCPDQNYIMGFRSSEEWYINNRFLFSCCSQRSFYATIKERGSCLLTTEAVPNYPSSADTNVATFLPGEVFTADDQCYLKEGTSQCSDWVYEKYNTDLCSVLWCIKEDDPTFCTASTATPAADGTSCGDDKWCFKGQCVYKGQTVSTDDQQCSVSECLWNEEKCDYGVNIVLPQMFRCYPDSSTCDGKIDCSDGSDEENCDRSRPDGYCYTCVDSNICVTTEQACERYCSHDYDCKKNVDSSDACTAFYSFMLLPFLMAVFGNV